MSEFAIDQESQSIPDQIVMHVDMDCFFAACERLRDKSLENSPVVVVMGYSKDSANGVVSTASYEAREYDVESGQPMVEAIRHLPQNKATYLPVDAEYYESISDEIMYILEEMSNVVRKVSVDEAYLDVTDRTNWEHAEGYAGGIKKRIQQEVGVTASIGVAPTMSAAKVASDWNKPDGITVVPPESLVNFLDPLDVEDVHEVGPKTAKQLQKMGMTTAGDIAEADVSKLRKKLGSRGKKIYRYARGEDDREVEPTEPRDSFMRDESFSEPISDWGEKRGVIKQLGQEAAERAIDEGGLFQTIGIKVIMPPFDKYRREQSLSGPTDDPDVVQDVAMNLLREFSNNSVRKLGVSVSNINYSGQRQTGLDDWR